MKEEQAVVEEVAVKSEVADSGESSQKLFSSESGDVGEWAPGTPELPSPRGKGRAVKVYIDWYFKLLTYVSFHRMTTVRLREMTWILTDQSIMEEGIWR